MLVSGKEEVKGVLKIELENLMNEKTERKAIVLSMDQVESVCRKEVKKAIDNFSVVKLQVWME